MAIEAEKILKHFIADPIDMVVGRCEYGIDAKLRDRGWVERHRRDTGTDYCWIIYGFGHLSKEETAELTRRYLKAGWGVELINNSYIAPEGATIIPSSPSVMPVLDPRVPEQQHDVHFYAGTSRDWRITLYLNKP